MKDHESICSNWLKFPFETKEEFDGASEVT